MDEQADIALLNTEMNQRDRGHLQDAAHRLLAHGSILRERAAERNLYDWCIEHQNWVEEWSTLLGMKLVVQRDERIIMVLPEVGALTRKLRRDETLVGLALWFDYDVEVRENAAHDVFFTVRQFNEQFRSKFPSLQALSASRLKEIFRVFTKINVVEMDWAEEFSESVIHILPTLRFIIPFPEIEEWHRVRDRFVEESDEDMRTPAEELPLDVAEASRLPAVETSESSSGGGLEPLADSSTPDRSEQSTSPPEVADAELSSSDESPDEQAVDEDEDDDDFQPTVDIPGSL